MTAGIYSKSIFTPYKTNLEPSLIYPVSGPGEKGTGDFQITEEVIAAIKIIQQQYTFNLATEKYEQIPTDYLKFLKLYKTIHESEWFFYAINFVTLTLCNFDTLKMNYILFDGTVRNALLPFTFTRPVADIRIGILTIREKWEKYLGYTTTTLTEEYLSEKFPMVEMEDNVMINASFLPNDILVEMVKNLEKNQAIFQGEEVIAFYTNDTQEEVDFDSYEIIEFNE
jgi:hypothetical protein